MDCQRSTMASVEKLLRWSDGVDLSIMFETILNLRNNIDTPAHACRTTWPSATPVAPILPNTTTCTPTILDYILKLQAPGIAYVSPDPNTLGKYVREQRLREPAEFMDEQEIWDIFRDIIVQVDQKCAAGNWSGEFSEGIPLSPAETNRRNDHLRSFRGPENLDFKNPRTGYYLI